MTRLLVSPAEPVSHLFRLRPAAGPVERNGIMTTKKCAATAADPLSDVLAEAKVMKADFEEQAEQWVKESGRLHHKSLSEEHLLQVRIGRKITSGFQYEAGRTT
jgi:hypothetical protein